MINIKSIWENQKPTGDVIIKTRIEEIQHLNCFAATNNFTGQHLFILSVSNTIQVPFLNNYHFKGVEIFTINAENSLELNIYLLDQDLKEIFSLFVQNILEEISNSITESEAINRTLNVISKWKKLFDKITFIGLTLEKQKGLIGELIFLNFLLDNEKTRTKAINAWTSAEQEFQSKDFTFGSVGIEIKFTSSKQPRIKVSNERQLDSESLKELYLVLYSTESVKENGISLNSLVEQIRLKIKTENERGNFNSKLQLNGYYDADSNYYDKMYSIKKIFAFKVTSDFPKLVKGDLPIGIYDTSYSVEISAAEKFIIEMDKLFLNF